jgi:hypothetical protein
MSHSSATDQAADEGGCVEIVRRVEAGKTGSRIDARLTIVCGSSTGLAFATSVVGEREIVGGISAAGHASASIQVVSLREIAINAHSTVTCLAIFG